MNSPIIPSLADSGANYLQPLRRESAGQENTTLLQVSSSTQTYYTRQESTIVTLSTGNSAQVVNAPSAAADISPKDAADNILQVISQRLAQFRAEGASTEELQVKIEQAKQGFSQGVAESQEVLESLGLLNDEQESRINTIIARFNEGIEQVAQNLLGDAGSLTNEVADLTQEQIGGANTAASEQTATSASTQVDNSPITSNVAAPLSNSENTAQSSAFTSNFQSSRAAFLSEGSLDLQLRTQDGDVVTVRFFSSQGGSASSSTGSFSNGQFSLDFSESFSQIFSNTDLQISVAGEIDEGELAALTELFGQLSKIANAFFNAEDDQAFNQALQLNVDAEEIAQFSFNLQSREVQQISQQLSQYREVDALKNEKHNHRAEESGRHHGHGKRLGFGHLLQQLREKALERTQVSVEKLLVDQLLSVSFAAASISVQSSKPEGDDANIFAPQIASTELPATNTEQTTENIELALPT